MNIKQLQIKYSQACVDANAIIHSTNAKDEDIKQAMILAPIYGEIAFELNELDDMSPCGDCDNMAKLNEEGVCSSCANDDDDEALELLNGMLDADKGFDADRMSTLEKEADGGSFTWFVTYNHLDEEEEKVTGWLNYQYSFDFVKKHGQYFEMFDDDGVKYFSGYSLAYGYVSNTEDHLFDPMDRYGNGSGCIDIKYRENGEMVSI